MKMKYGLCLLALLCGAGAHAQHYVCKTGPGSYYQSPSPCSEQPGAVEDWQQQTHLQGDQSRGVDAGEGNEVVRSAAPVEKAVSEAVPQGGNNSAPSQASQPVVPRETGLQDTGQKRREKLQPQSDDKAGECAQLENEIASREQVARDGYVESWVDGRRTRMRPADVPFYQGNSEKLRDAKERYYRLRCNR